MVDCNHGNSQKNHNNQALVVESVAQQVESGSPNVLGVMLESHLVSGRQDLGETPTALRYGQSITDACIDVRQTEVLLHRLAAAGAVGRQRPKH